MRQDLARRISGIQVGAKDRRAEKNKVAKIHNRMPVILHAESCAKWLGEEPATLEELESLCVPFPSDLMTMWPVNPRMNTWRYDADDTLEPFESDPINSL